MIEEPVEVEAAAPAKAKRVIKTKAEPKSTMKAVEKAAPVPTIVKTAKSVKAAKASEEKVAAPAPAPLAVPAPAKAVVAKPAAKAKPAPKAKEAAAAPAKPVAKPTLVTTEPKVSAAKPAATPAPAAFGFGAAFQMPSLPSFEMPSFGALPTADLGLRFFETATTRMMEMRKAVGEMQALLLDHACQELKAGLGEVEKAAHSQTASEVLVIGAAAFRRSADALAGTAKAVAETAQKSLAAR